MSGVNLAELFVEAVEGRHVGVLDRRIAVRTLLAGGVLALALRSRRDVRRRR
jgi:hypothetical protein